MQVAIAREIRVAFLERIYFCKFLGTGRPSSSPVSLYACTSGSASGSAVERQSAGKQAANKPNRRDELLD